MCVGIDCSREIAAVKCGNYLDFSEKKTKKWQPSPAEQRRREVERVSFPTYNQPQKKTPTKKNLKKTTQKCKIIKLGTKQKPPNIKLRTKQKPPNSQIKNPEQTKTNKFSK